MIERIGLDDWFLRMTEVTALRSTCLRRQVGCVLVNRKHHVIATGYNGVTRGREHCNEGIPLSPNEYAVRHKKDFTDTDIVVERRTGRLSFDENHVPQDIVTRTFYPHACPGATAPSGTNLDGCYAVHAEQNALLQCKDTDQIWSCYVTCSPCLTCVKLLLNTSCLRIVFTEPYAHDSASRDLWQSAKRLWLSRREASPQTSAQYLEPSP